MNALKQKINNLEKRLDNLGESYREHTKNIKDQREDIGAQDRVIGDLVEEMDGLHGTMDVIQEDALGSRNEIDELKRTVGI